MTNLPKRPPVDIEFNNLSYSGDSDEDGEDDKGGVDDVNDEEEN